jgi:hypothetical protein
MALRRTDTPHPGEFATIFRGRGRPRIDPTIEARIHARAIQGWSAPAILRELEAEKVVGRPALRTVQRVVRDLQSIGDDSAPWSLLEAEADEAELVLPALAGLLDRALGEGKTTLTQVEAAAVIHVRRAAPTLHPYPAYVVAMEYLFRASQGAPTTDLDFYLGSRPWEHREEHAHRYTFAIALSHLGLPRHLQDLPVFGDRPDDLDRPDSQREDDGVFGDRNDG